MVNMEHSAFETLHASAENTFYQHSVLKKRPEDMTVLDRNSVTGGINFDAKLRRESTSLVDLFYGHISGMDAMARGLRNAAKMLEVRSQSQCFFF